MHVRQQLPGGRPHSRATRTSSAPSTKSRQGLQRPIETTSSQAQPAGSIASHEHRGCPGLETSVQGTLQSSLISTAAVSGNSGPPRPGARRHPWLPTLPFDVVGVNGLAKVLRSSPYPARAAGDFQRHPSCAVNEPRRRLIRAGHASPECCRCDCLGGLGAARALRFNLPFLAHCPAPQSPTDLPDRTPRPSPGTQ